jgi:hypothetical protein
MLLSMDSSPQPGYLLDTRGRYRILVRGALDAAWSDRLGGMAISAELVDGAPATTLIGDLADQSALVGVLNTLHDLGIPLVAVERIDAGADNRQAAPPAAGGAQLYQLREKLASVGNDFWIENSAGQRVYKVDGRALRIRETFKIKDLQSREAAEILGKPAGVRDTMDITRGGRTIASVKKAQLTPAARAFLCPRRRRR